MPITSRPCKYGKNVDIIPQTAFCILLALALTAGLLGVTTGTARADVNLFVTVKDCVTGLPIAGAQIKVPTANLNLKSASQAVANDKGVANVDPLRTEGRHIIEVSAPGYRSLSLDVTFPAWTKQEVEICLQPENPSTSPAKSPAGTSDCNRAALAMAEQRVANLETKLDQADTAKGDALDRWLQAREDYREAKVRANQSQNRANDSARTAGYAKRHAETAMQLARDKPGSPTIYQYIERAVMRAEIAQGYAVAAVDGGNLQEVILLHQKLTALDLYGVIEYYGAPNPYTDAEYIKAAQDIIKVAERAAEIAQAAADGYRATRDELLAKQDAASAAYLKAKESEAAIKSELAQTRVELNALRDACSK